MHKMRVSFVNRFIALAAALYAHTAVVAAQFPTAVLVDYLTVARQSVFFTSGNSCPTYTTWSTQTCTAFGSNAYGTVANVAPITSAVDNNAATIAHTDGGTGAGVITAMYMLLDLQEPRLITTVGLLSRSDCCFNREGGWECRRCAQPCHSPSVAAPVCADNAFVILANTEAIPSTITGATACINPGPSAGLSTWRNYSCANSAPARFVYLAVFCATVASCAPINPAEIRPYGALQSCASDSGGGGMLFRVCATLDVPHCRPSHHDSHRLFNDDVYAELWVQPGEPVHDCSELRQRGHRREPR